MNNSTSTKPSRQAPVTTIAVAAARRWPLTLMVWAAVLALGLLAFFGGLGREGFPPINVPIVVVDGTYFVDNEETVDQDVAQPLADRYGDVDGVASVQSIALGNAFAVIVEFEDSFSSDEGAVLLNDATTEVSLPVEASAEVRTVNAAKFLDVYDVLISLTGPEGATPEDLEAQAAKLATELESDGSVQTAEVRNLLTEGLNPATGVEEVRQTRFVRVAFAETDAYTDAIAIGVVRTEDSDLDIIGFSDRLNGLVDSTNALDDGYAAAVTADFATDIKAQISNLSSNLLTGLIAVAIVSFLLIGWRVSFVAAGFMATVVLAALAALWFFGYSLNTITLFGLILTLGLLVDDAIVIAESIDANRQEDDEPLGVVRTAIDRVGSASLAGTLTTVLVFTPMLFVPGIIGEFIRSIPATVIITLVISFLASIIFIPAVAKPVLLQGSGEPGPIVRAEMAIARGLGRLAEYPSSHGFKGVAVGLGIVAASLGIIFSSFQIAATLGFNIFPPGDDANALFVNVDFEPGTTLEEAQALTEDVDAIVLDTLGDDLIRSQYLTGTERQMIAIVDLVPFNDRSTTAPDYVEQMQTEMDELDGMRIDIRPLENGPPVEEFPFAAQIAVDDSTVANAQSLAVDLRDALVGTELDKSGGDPTTIVDAIVSTEDQVFRSDGVRQIEVRAAFSSDDLTNNLDATELLVADLFGADDLEARGLDADAIAFDYGLESDNQEDFASLFSALLIALGLMFLLLVIQFRSIVQPLLIFLAIPFSFFGVFTILSATNNPISFLVTVGFIALIGVVVNNSILLVDAANQARRDGLRPGEAIGQAVTRRFRPLVATTITTVAGLLPLALADPFFESLSFTLIGGLVSSTILVLVAFPVFYLAVERVRTPLRNAVRARTGRELI